MPPIQKEPHTQGRRATISVAILLVIILAVLFGYKWYRTHTSIRADQLTDKEEEAYLREAVRKNDARPTISEQDQNKYTEQVLKENGKPSALTEAEMQAYVNEKVQ